MYSITNDSTLLDKSPKPFVFDLESAVKGGASPGPFLPKPNYAYQNNYRGF